MIVGPVGYVNSIKIQANVHKTRPYLHLNTQANLSHYVAYVCNTRTNSLKHWNRFRTSQRNRCNRQYEHSNLVYTNFT